MKVSKINNNVTFGYNKKLNKELKSRLNQNPDVPINQALLTINDTCNTLEGQIKQLEKSKGKVERNYSQINVLADYLIHAKIFLCEMADRLFPDLNFLDRECDSYDKETSRLESREFDDPNISAAYYWRDDLVDALLDSADKKPTTTREKQKVGGEEGTSFNLEVEKFKPKSYSPKSLDDICGLNNIVQDIRDLVLFPLQNPQVAQQRKDDYGIDIPNFVLLYGPPGCGKTMLAEAIAIETGCDMYCLDLSKVGSSYINETSEKVKSFIDEVVDKSKKSDKPVILFIDEMDSLLSKRSSDEDGKEDNKVVNTLLTAITDIQDENIMIIGATNMYDLIDPAVKSRSDLVSYIGLPNQKEAGKLLQIYLSKSKMGKHLAEDKEQIENLSKICVGYSGRNIRDLVKASQINAYRNNREITAEDIEYAIKNSDIEKIKEEDYIPENKKKKVKMGFGVS